MASATGRSLRDHFIQPDAEVSDGDFVVEHPGSAFVRRQRRNANLFDAVAGRVSNQSRLNPAAGTSTPPAHLNLTHSSTAMRPDEVLFRSARAPERFPDSDMYWASDHLSSSAPAGPSPLAQAQQRQQQALQRLPDSDLLKAVHAYAADFYGRPESAGAEMGQVAGRSMDETALLAFGILLEESAGGILGRSGHNALVEGSAGASGSSESGSGGESSRGGSFGSSSAEEMMMVDERDEMAGEMPTHRRKRMRFH